jgi:glyoxylase-like metal-dependent hydrolase (beta-lactamase superfamily II)
VCLYFPAEKLLVAGDTLFARSIGRTDLPGGSFEKIMRSLHDRVMTLPDDTVVIPGHGTRTTIGEEKEENPFLAGWENEDWETTGKKPGRLSAMSCFIIFVLVLDSGGLSAARLVLVSRASNSSALALRPRGQN